jgi:hypothetical protein
MSYEMTIRKFVRHIQALPSDEFDPESGVWYHTEKEHWLGWLSEYDGPGAYGRTGVQQRDARFAYNHLVNPYMLMYLIEAIPMRPELVEAAQMALKANANATLMQMSGAIRKVVPWTDIYEALAERKKPSA